MSRGREIAKFFCGVVAFHAFGHGVLWLSGTGIIVFGTTTGARWHIAGAIVNAIVAIVLGKYAWGPHCT